MKQSKLDIICLFVAIYSALMATCAFLGIYRTSAGIDRIWVAWIHVVLFLIAIAILAIARFRRGTP